MLSGREGASLWLRHLDTRGQDLRQDVMSLSLPLSKDPSETSMCPLFSRRHLDSPMVTFRAVGGQSGALRGESRLLMLE